MCTRAFSCDSDAWHTAAESGDTNISSPHTHVSAIDKYSAGWSNRHERAGHARRRRWHDAATDGQCADIQH